MLHIEDGFGYWVAGFTDGEGCFAINISKRNYGPKDPHGHKTDKTYISWAPYFQLTQRADTINKELLDLVQNTLNVGTVYPSKNKGNKAPQFRFVVRKVEDLCQVIIPLFEKYPLRSKKRLEFEVWAKGVKALYNERQSHHISYNKRGERGYQICLQTKNDLANLRIYKPDLFNHV